MATVFAVLAPGEIPGREHGRPIVVVDDLSEMRAPAAGEVELPLHLDWSPRRAYDLGNHKRLLSMYATVLREATKDEDVQVFLNADVLIAEWKNLFLPKHVRAAWETVHPLLGQYPSA